MNLPSVQRNCMDLLSRTKKITSRKMCKWLQRPLWCISWLGLIVEILVHKVIMSCLTFKGGLSIFSTTRELCEMYLMFTSSIFLILLFFFSHYSYCVFLDLISIALIDEARQFICLPYLFFWDALKRKTFSSHWWELALLLGFLLSQY